MKKILLLLLITPIFAAAQTKQPPKIESPKIISETDVILVKEKPMFQPLFVPYDSTELRGVQTRIPKGTKQKQSVK